MVEAQQQGERVRRVLVLATSKPNTAAKRAIEQLERLEQDRAFDYEIVRPEPMSADALTRECRREMEKGIDAVIAIDGDGMVQLGVSLVAGTTVPLGIVPTGPDNDFARTMGIPHSSTNAALDQVLRGLEHPEAASRTIDAIRLTVDGRTQWVANAITLGLAHDAFNKATSMRGRLGRLRMLFSSRAVIPKLKTVPFRIGLDGRPPRIHSRMFIAICNGTSIEGGVRIAPDADVADGLLDVVTLRPVSRMTFARMLPSLLSGTHGNIREISIRRANTVEVEVPPDVPITADGVPVGNGGRLRAELMPAAWRLLRL